METNRDTETSSRYIYIDYTEEIDRSGTLSDVSDGLPIVKIFVG